MSVQIQFQIIDQFIQFSPDVTIVLKLLTKALDVIFGNLFCIYKGFSESNGHFLSTYLLKNCNNYKLLRVLSVLNVDCRVIAGPLSNQSFSWLSNFSNTCAALQYNAEQDFCQILVRMRSFEKLLYFFQTPESDGRVDSLPTRHLFHNNHFFTVPEDSNLDLPADTEFLKSFVMLY